MLHVRFALLGALAAVRGYAASPDPLASLEDRQRALFGDIAPAVVVVSAATSVSAGFFVAPDLVLTTAHGIAGAAEVSVALLDGRVLAGHVISSAPGGLDLALLRVPASGARVLAPAPDPMLRAGDLVVAVGHGDGSRWSFASGMVSSPQADGADGSLARLQLAVRPGASGAPVVSRAGRLVGVVVQGDASSVAFAVRSDAILRAFPVIPPAPPDAEAAAPIARDEEAPAPAPLHAPALVFGPPDPRPSDARSLRAAPPVRAKVARPALARAARPARPARLAAPASEPVQAVGTFADELAPAAALAIGGVALAAVVLAAAALVPAPLRPARRRLTAAPAPPRESSRRRAPASPA